LTEEQFAIDRRGSACVRCWTAVYRSKDVELAEAHEYSSPQAAAGEGKENVMEILLDKDFLIE
jgi:hypothetical protein